MRPVRSNGLGPLLVTGTVLGLTAWQAPLVGLALFLIYALVVWIDHRLEVLRARR